MVVDGAGVGKGVVPPHDFQDFFPAYNLAGLGYEEAEQLAFPFGDALFLACLGHDFKGIKIDVSAMVESILFQDLNHLYQAILVT